MEGLEQQLGAILNNPQMMANLMQMAQNLSSANPPQPQAPPQPEAPQAPPQLEAPQPSPAAQAGSFADFPIDIGMLQRIGAMAQNTSIDSQQKNLLSALTPYLHDDRISRLEKAMRAAKLARFAASAFSGR